MSENSEISRVRKGSVGDMSTSSKNETADSPNRPNSATQTQPKASMIRRNSLMRQTVTNTFTFKYSAALDKVNAGNDEERNTLEDFRVEIKKYLSTSRGGRVYLNLTILLSIMSAVIAIHETYAFDEHQRYLNQRHIFDIFDVIFAVVFGFDWLLNYFLADSKFYYFWR
jgi:hypothetical protein